MIIQFDHPDCERPAQITDSSDRRRIAFSFEKLRLFRVEHNPPPAVIEPPVGSSPRSMLMRFESLGDNCEFGIVQRRTGAEPLGLLRFSGQPIDLLVKALDERFIRMLVSDELRVSLASDRQQYDVYILTYGMLYHTFIKATEMAINDVKERQIKQLKFKIRNFLEIATEGQKIFVFKRNKPLHLDEILPLFAALNRIGPSPLMVVCPASPVHPATSIDVVMPGLFVGYLTEFGNIVDALPKSISEWIILCREALLLAAHIPTHLATALTSELSANPK